jgi:hypothetical protein
MLTIRTQSRMELVPIKETVYISKTPYYSKEQLDDMSILWEGKGTGVDPKTKKPLCQMRSIEISNYIEENYIKDTFSIYIGNINLGQYVTIERALKVLDEIQVATLGNLYLDYEKAVAASLPSVYEMPKE